jgi:hypothetical protein
VSDDANLVGGFREALRQSLFPRLAMHQQVVAGAIAPSKGAFLQYAEGKRQQPFMRKRIVDGEHDRAAASERAKEEQGSEREVKDVLKMDDIAAADREKESGARREQEEKVRPQFAEYAI